MARPPKPVTRRRLAWAARRYLERWFTARAHLARLLERRAERAIAVHGGDRDEVRAWIASILDDLESQGLLDDARFATDRARLLHRRGASTRKIAWKLREKGVPRPLIDRAIEALPGQGDVDLRAAANLVRKRRMGPYRDDPERHRDRDLGRLARAGFSYEIARTVLDLPDRDAVEALSLSV